MANSLISSSCQTFPIYTISGSSFVILSVQLKILPFNRITTATNLLFALTRGECTNKFFSDGGAVKKCKMFVNIILKRSLGTYVPHVSRETLK